MDPRPVIGFSQPHYNASYLYDYGDGHGEKDSLPSKDTLNNYLAELSILFDNDGQVLSSTTYYIGSIMGRTPLYHWWYYDFASSNWNRDAKSTDRHRVMLDSL